MNLNNIHDITKTIIIFVTKKYLTDLMHGVLFVVKHNNMHNKN